MGIRETAEADLGFILEDSQSGAGWPIQVIDPDGAFADLVGYSSDISQVIDPDTGQAVSGRLASIALRMSTLRAKGLEVPKGIADSALKPWMIVFDDILGKPWKFKVSRSSPDRALGIVVCYLEFYSE